jgi:lipoprotein signal peptidase
VPLAGTSVFAGLSMLTLAQLRAEGIAFGWVGGARGALLALGLAWSALLGARVILGSNRSLLRRLAALPVFALPLAAVGGLWFLTFYVW